jgi:hypothetical protein
VPLPTSCQASVATLKEAGLEAWNAMKNLKNGGWRDLGRRDLRALQKQLNMCDARSQPGQQQQPGRTLVPRLLTCLSRELSVALG